MECERHQPGAMGCLKKRAVLSVFFFSCTKGLLNYIRIFLSHAVNRY